VLLNVLKSLVKRRGATVETVPANCVASLLEQGLRSQKDGDLGGAERAFRAALIQAPSNVDAAHLLGVLLHRAGRLQEAVDMLEHALALAPGQAEIHLHLGSALQARGMFAQAETSYRTAIRLRPQMTAAHVSLVSLLRELGHFDEAHGAANHAISLNAESAELWQNLGCILHDIKLGREAVDAFERALAIEPTMSDAHYSLAMTLLADRQFERGWREYESRFQLARWDGPRQVPKLPVWGGEHKEDALLVYGEQGIGDEIMFASCLPDLLRHGPNTILACSRKLESLFRRSFPTAEVICLDRLNESGSSPLLGRATAMIAAGSLPGMYRRTAADFPRHRGYLVPQESLTLEYRTRLDALGPGIKVGLSWRGGTERTRGAQRSLDASDLGRILHCPGVRFVNLQYDISMEDADVEAAVQEGKLVYWPDALQDYDRTAALVSSLDVIVSVCTAVIHLSGALGRPTMVMAPYSAEWRYGTQGEDMPWYPSVHIERQVRRGQWSTVIDAVQDRLKRFAPG
jgi:tetratricopeptide (TPR) repeat protein